MQHMQLDSLNKLSVLLLQCPRLLLRLDDCLLQVSPRLSLASYSRDCPFQKMVTTRKILECACKLPKRVFSNTKNSHLHRHLLRSQCALQQSREYSKETALHQNHRNTIDIQEWLTKLYIDLTLHISSFVSESEERLTSDSSQFDCLFVCYLFVWFYHEKIKMNENTYRATFCIHKTTNHAVCLCTVQIQMSAPLFSSDTSVRNSLLLLLLITVFLCILIIHYCC